jgi:hypothetical protein
MGVALGGEMCFPCFVVFTLQKQMTEVLNYRKPSSRRGSRRKSRKSMRGRQFRPRSNLQGILRRKQDTGVFNPYTQGLWGSLIANCSYTVPLTKITNGTAEYQRGNDCAPLVDSTVGEFIIYQEVNTLCTYRFIGVTTHSPYVILPNVPQLDLLYNLINPVTILTGPTKRHQDQTPVLFRIWHDSFITLDTNNGNGSQIKKYGFSVPPARCLFNSSDTHGDTGLGMQFIVVLTDAPVANANYSMQFNGIRTFHCNR